MTSSIETTPNSSKNILYLLNHKTLTDFEVPILMKRGFGVYIPKKFGSINKTDHSFSPPSTLYDESLKMSVKDYLYLNKVDFFCENPFHDEKLMYILNNNFSSIITTLITKLDDLKYLLNNYKGVVYLRIFGNDESYSYYTNYLKGNEEIFSKNIKFAFCFKEIIKFENTIHSHFNSNNSLYIPCGLPDYFFSRYENTYNPTNSSCVFVCSKINVCSYYTDVYNRFNKIIQNKDSRIDFIILGKNNEDASKTDNRIKNNLPDEEYFGEMSTCIAMYYDSKEPRHLHYHPIEAIIIGLPLIFHRESVLTSFFPISPGKCNTDEEVIEKLSKLRNGDVLFKNSIIEYQNGIKHIFKIENNLHIFDEIA